MKKLFLCVCLALLLVLPACSGPEPVESDLPVITPPPTPELALPTPTPEPAYSGPFNPLSGLPIDEQWADRRPVAIMLNNLKAALPQLGQSQADIIYECLAEGGITRMLGVYQSLDGVGAIGSVRSARPYYLELALGHDAIFLHAGGSPDAYSKIRSWSVTALDCVNGPYEGRKPGENLFWRDADRRRNNGYEHSVITTGEAIKQQFAKETFRQEHEEGYHYDMAFAPDGTPDGGVTANTITVPFSNYKTGVFTYEPSTGLYLVEEYGKPYIDGNTGGQVGVTNIIVIKTRCRAISGDDQGRITVDLTSGGTGYYACGGKLIDILWSKEGVNGQLSYTDLDGVPITLGQGHSYVNIITLDAKVTAE